MKKYFLTMGLCLLSLVASAQWLTDMSCNDKSAEITDKAITHMFNIETSLAVGMANAALMVDKNCGAAKLVVVNSKLANEYGTRNQKLEKLNTANFTAQEKAWYKIMAAPDSEEQNMRLETAEKYSSVPLFAFAAAVIDQNGKDGLAQYVETFPAYASPAYNIMSYRYADGFYGESNMDKAIETVKKVFLTHNGPNAHDSMAEHYASMGDYNNAFKHQAMAVDYASGGSSVYGLNAGIYFAHTNKAALSDTLTVLTKRRIAHQMKNDYKNLAQYFSDKAGMIACNSNMEPCIFYATLIEEEEQVTWNRWDIKDLKIHFSPDMKMAITTFNSDGEYIIKGSEDPVTYNTRASEIWIMDNGWKLMHSNFAPLALGSGIPKTN